MKTLKTEQVSKLIEAYENNKDSLYTVDSYLENNSLDISDVHDTYEMGYNNALQYVFDVLGVEDYEKPVASVTESRIKELKEQIDHEEKKMECCAYSKQDLRYVEELKKELAILE